MPLLQVSDHTFFSQYIRPESVIVDLGANRGAFSRQMIETFGCSAIAIEANPRLAAAIPKTCGLEVINAAVASKPGVMRFHINDNNDEASSLLGSECSSSINVKAILLEDVIFRTGRKEVDLLKVDIEGAEIEVLENCPEALLKRISQITVEFHDFNQVVSSEQVGRVIRRLRDLGFAVLPMWMRTHGDTLFLNRKLIDLNALNWFWYRYVVRNWWWFRRFVHRKLRRSSAPPTA